MSKIWPKIMSVMLVMLVVVMPVRESYAFSEAGDEVSLQVQLIVANQGVLINGEKTVIVRLKSEGEVEMHRLWEKSIPRCTYKTGC